MDANEFINLLNNPDKVEGKSVEELKRLATEYPFSQSVQLLYAIRLSQSSEYLFNRQLGRTSILTDDRSVLFDLFERGSDELSEGEIDLSSFKIETPPAEKISVEKPDVPAKELPEDKKEQKTNAPAPEASKPVVEVPPKQTESKTPEKTSTPKEKVDLSKLSPSERIKAILEENRRLREEFAGRKSEETLSPAKPEPELVQEQQIDEPVEEVAEELSVEEVISIVEEIEQEEVDLPQLEIEEIEEELPVFTIEQESADTLFVIEDDETGSSENEDRIDDSETDLDEDDEPDFLPVEHLEEIEYAPVRDKYSFGGWLKHLTHKDAEPDDDKVKTPTQGKSTLEEKLSLLDAFVEKLPALKQKARFQQKEEAPKDSINMNRLMDDNEEGSMVTETLARVYIKQKHYDKAIKAYEIMKLKYPEKSSFFADQISEIKKLSNSK